MKAAHFALFVMTSSPLGLYRNAPTRDLADGEFARLRDRALRADANDMPYAFDASRNYNPEPVLERIEAPLVAVNSAERTIERVKHGKYVLIPAGERTRGHGTHSTAALCRQWLEVLPAAPERSSRHA